MGNTIVGMERRFKWWQHPFFLVLLFATMMFAVGYGPIRAGVAAPTCQHVWQVEEWRYEYEATGLVEQRMASSDGKVWYERFPTKANDLLTRRVAVKWYCERCLAETTRKP